MTRFATLLICAVSALAQAVPAGPAPTLRDIRYGEHPKQTIDFYKANSDRPTPLVVYIHGGGWTAGTKNNVAGLQQFLDAGISVASVEYRFIQDAMELGIQPPVRAPLYDAARAIQLLRSRAGELNFDKKRVAYMGGSAGACTSLWLALHDDLADPSSSDPISRESTRPMLIAVTAPQTSLDPQQTRSWIPNMGYGGHAFGFRAEGRTRPRSSRCPTTHGRKSWPGSTSPRPTNTPVPAILPFTWTTQTRKNQSFREPIRRTPRIRRFWA